MILGDDRLASITKSMVVPDTAAEKPFGATEQRADVSGQQNPALLARKAVGEEGQKPGEQPRQLCDILSVRGGGLPWFPRETKNGFTAHAGSEGGAVQLVYKVCPTFKLAIPPRGWHWLGG